MSIQLWVLVIVRLLAYGAIIWLAISSFGSSRFYLALLLLVLYVGYEIAVKRLRA